MILRDIDDYDWKEAFGYAYFDQEDVVGIVHIDDGENNVASWIGLFELEDGRYGGLVAGCDYTGWD